MKRPDQRTCAQVLSRCTGVIQCMTMNDEQQQSILAGALFAAFADGARHDREREEIRRIAKSPPGTDSIRARSRNSSPSDAQ